MIYKNTSRCNMTFYNVTFKPGEVKEVPGYINNIHFIRCNEADLKKPENKPAKQTQKQVDNKPKVDVKQDTEDAKTSIDDKEKAKQNEVKEAE